MGELQRIETNQLEVINREEIDMQIATAKRYPRSLENFVQNATFLATQDLDVAVSCNYRLKRKGQGGKDVFIEGPSIRVAEIALSEWGNCRVYTRVLDDNGDSVVAESVFLDLEKNIAIRETVSRRILNKDGKRYSLDMINVTKGAACAIAKRNAILGGIPRSFINQIASKAKQVAIGTKSTIKSRIKLMFDKFKALGVESADLLKKIDKNGVLDITLSDIEALIGLYTAITDGTTSVEQQFRVPTKPDVIITVGPQDDELSNDVFQKKITELASESDVQECDINKIMASELKVDGCEDYTKTKPEKQSVVLAFWSHKAGAK